MDDALVEQLTGRRFPKSGARLRGYRKCVPVEGYPYIISDVHGEVDGAVLYEVDTAALQVFDEYEDEGRLYRRIEVTLTVGGQPTRAFVYVAAAR